MSLTRIEIRNFQSLRQVDIDLGVFTVIVGPSSSGKSALMRAFRALASNVRGNGVITRGQKFMAITGVTDTHTIALERSDRSGSYRVSSHLDQEKVTFTKLAGEVPEQVTRILRIDPVTERGSVNFASQFDKPYLLDESGATVARELGELTNVSRIFEAVRAANRIRSSAASTLRTRKNDLDEVRTALAGFTTLSEQLSLLEQADKLDAERRELANRVARLDNALRTVHIAAVAIEKATLPEVPSADRLTATLDAYQDLQARLQAIEVKGRRVRQESTEVQARTDELEHLTQALAQKLQGAKVCPTCGQTTN